MTLLEQRGRTGQPPKVPQPLCENALTSVVLTDAEILGKGLDYPTCLALGIHNLAPWQQVNLTASEVKTVSSLASFRKEEKIITLSRKQLGQVLHGLLLSCSDSPSPTACRHFHNSMFLHGLDNHPGNTLGTRRKRQRHLLPGRVIITPLGQGGVPHAFPCY